MSDKFLRLNQVIDQIGLSRSTIYNRIKEGSFPHPIKLGKRAIAWRESTITDWMNQQTLPDNSKVTIEHSTISSIHEEQQI